MNCRVSRAAPFLSEDDEIRLAEIRGALERHRAFGVDVSTWEAEFLLSIIERLKRSLRQREGSAS